MKKQLLTLICIVATLYSYAQVNQKDAQGRRHGKWEKFHDNGKKRYSGYFEHGQEVGTFKFYFETGEIKAINKFRGKSAVCYSYQFGADSVLAAEGKYINTERDSVWTFYDIDGNVVARESYARGVRQGPSITYFPSGKVAESFQYKNGKRSGEWLQFYESGKPRAKGQYVDGSLQGESIYYHPSGKIRMKGKYVKGLMHGNWYFFSERMEVEKKQVWDRGTMVSQDPPPVEEEDEEGIEPVNGVPKSWRE